MSGAGDTKPVLGYWKIRGLAEPARMMLHYAKVDFEDKTYDVGPAPEYDRSDWFNVKHTLGLPFANLPYLIDGDNKICQSGAIYKYIARKHGLVGDDEASKLRIDMVENQLVDLRTQFVGLCYRRYDTDKDTYAKDTLPNYLKGFAEFLGDNEWFGGKKLTYVDFMAHEILFHHRCFKKDCLDEHENLVKFMKRFEELPEIKAYLASSGYEKRPLNNKMAKFGSTAEY